MIKLIIFDLDGVLIESKKAHFKALNMSLEYYRQDPITFDEHISKYDGLSTLNKLRKRAVDPSLHDRINKKKQQYTYEMMESLSSSPELIELFIRLKEENFFIHVASNAVRYTVQLILFKLGVMRYVDYYISNEDVVYPKPHSEMYIKCMLNASVGPRETLIIEDSYVGRQGVYNSGAFLCPVTCPKDVSYNYIKANINKYQRGITMKWKSDTLTVLIPMAGAGKRFEQVGYTFPKPLIDIKGKPMIQVVVENLNIEANYVFIVQKQHYEKYNMSYLLELIAPGCKIIQVEGITEGAACTTLLAKEYINNDRELFISNSDQWAKWDSSDFMYSVQTEGIDAAIPVFHNTHPKWSYAKTDEEGYVVEVREKAPISTHATVGFYYWKKGSDYVHCAEQMIAKNIRTNEEFYVAPVYNEAIGEGKKVKIYEIEEISGLGTPEDLNDFLKKDLI